jgi:hypothetical protein
MEPTGNLVGLGVVLGALFSVAVTMSNSVDDNVKGYHT